MSLCRQSVALVLTTKNNQTQHYIHQKHKRETEKSALANKTIYTLNWYAFYDLQPGNGVDPILTAPKPTQGPAKNTTDLLYCDKRQRKWNTMQCIPGMSEKSKMHSLNPNLSSWSRSCRRMATPIQRGNEELPSSSMSHRWKILCSGNTSVYNNIDTQWPTVTNADYRTYTKHTITKLDESHW